LTCEQVTPQGARAENGDRCSCWLGGNDVETREKGRRLSTWMAQGQITTNDSCAHPAEEITLP